MFKLYETDFLKRHDRFKISVKFPHTLNLSNLTGETVCVLRSFLLHIKQKNSSGTLKQKCFNRSINDINYLCFYCALLTSRHSFDLLIFL